MKFDNDTLKIAVKEWIKNSSKAEKKYGHISDWDTSGVTDMNFLFENSRDFNYDIGRWDTSNVTDMSGMFYCAESFNQDIGRWNVSNVNDMGGMFSGATLFNQDIGDWDVSNVTNMFYSAYSYFDAEVIDGMFSGASSFNQDISRWDVSKVENMRGMFYEAKSFNQDIGRWDVSNVKEMSSMFEKASSFNQNLSAWDISRVEDFNRIFSETSMPSKIQDSNEEQNQQEWLSEYFDKYIPPVVLYCEILKCKIQEDPRNDFTELVYIQCIINTEKLEYILEICDEGNDGFFLHKGGGFEDDFDSGKWENISETKEGDLFLNAILIEENIDFSKENINSIEGMEFRIEK